MKLPWQGRLLMGLTEGGMKLRGRLRDQCQEEGAQPAMELLDGQGGV